jgi:threonine/homoserine/homoserine lactone efflux protein
MNFTEYLISILVLLLAPGPTNTLIGLAASQRGVTAAMRLVPFEMAGYALTILPLTIIGTTILTAFPLFAAVLKLAAAAWVAATALRLWRQTSVAHISLVSQKQVFITTALNPKALIFGLVLLPGFGAPVYWERFVALFLSVAFAAALWGLGGAVIHNRAGHGPLRYFHRIASVWLAVISFSLVIGVVQA